MGKLIGIVVLVLGLWMGMEIYQNGVAGAFGGMLGGGDDAETRTTAPQRAGTKVKGAHTEADERRNRMLGE